MYVSFKFQNTVGFFITTEKKQNTKFQFHSQDLLDIPIPFHQKVLRKFSKIFKLGQFKTDVQLICKVTQLKFFKEGGGYPLKTQPNTPPPLKDAPGCYECLLPDIFSPERVRVKLESDDFLLEGQYEADERDLGERESTVEFGRRDAVDLTCSHAHLIVAEKQPPVRS